MSAPDPLRRYLPGASHIPIPETCRCSLCDHSDKSAVEQHMDEIAALLGCPHWEYAGQVVNDVRGLLAYVERLEAALVRLAESVEPGPKTTADTHDYLMAIALGREIRGRRA